MLKSKRYKIIKLLIQLGDVIIDSKLGKKLESNYHQSTKGVFMKCVEFLAWDKKEEVLFKVGSINLPLGSPSWKDMSVEEEEGWAWRGIDEVVLLRYTGSKEKGGKKLYEVINYSKEYVKYKEGELIALSDNILVTQSLSEIFTGSKGERQ